MSSWRTHLKLTLRVLMRRKAFTAISLFGIAFTLATLVVAASMLDASFGDRAPDPDRDLTPGVYVMRMAGEQHITNGGLGFGFIEACIRPLKIPESVVALSTTLSTSVYSGERKYDVSLRLVEAGFWDLSRFRFTEGGPFSAADDASGRLVAVINETMRDRLFGGPPAAGREFEYEGRSFRVVGVVPDVSPVRRASYSEIWIPLGASASSTYREQVRGDFLALVRLKSPADKAAADAELQERLAAWTLPAGYTEVQAGIDTPFESASREILSEDMSVSRPGLLLAILLALAVAFMVLPAMNLSNLAISRTLERSAEIGVRKAFGARPAQLVAQLLAENLVLTFLGAAISLPAAALTLRLINGSGLIPYADFSIGWRAFLWGAAAAAAFGILSGIYPAWRLSRLEPAAAMRGRRA